MFGIAWMEFPLQWSVNGILSTNDKWKITSVSTYEDVVRQIAKSIARIFHEDSAVVWGPRRTVRATSIAIQCSRRFTFL